MIKAEDLRVGDLVKVIGTESVFTDGEICSVESVDKLYGVASLKGIDWGIEECGFLKNSREIDPIPLTPEILEKNRFEVGYPEKCYNKFISSPGRKLIRFLSIENWPTEWKVFLKYTNRTDHYVLLRFVKYVHELQHILWALGADANLKI